MSPSKEWMDNALLAELTELRELMREVAGSGVELDDSRMSYVVVQIGRETWGALRKVVNG